MKSISVVIPCGGSEKERVRNLKETISCLQAQSYQEFELILVEQSVDGNYYHGTKPCSRYIPISDPANRGFNRSWCRNVGAYAAGNETILLMDGDYVFPRGYLQKVASMQAPFFGGANLYLWSDEQVLKKYLENRDFRVSRQCRMRLRPFLRGIACGGIVGFERNWYLNTFVGYVENFFKYGFEDTEAANRIQRILNIRPDQIPIIKEAVMHLHHRTRDAPEKSNSHIYGSIVKQPVDSIKSKLLAAGIGSRQLPNLI